MVANRKIRLGIVFGGQSCEHEVSVTSARCIYQALDPQKYDIQLIGISKEGDWVFAGSDQKQLEAKSVESKKLPALPFDYFNTGKLPQARQFENSDSFQPVDVVFPVLHGPFGEDGTIQGFLELAGIPYVGSGVTGSAVGMDKAIAKKIYDAEGIPQARYSIVQSDEWKADSDLILKNLELYLCYPMFIKPANMGSSVGVSKANTKSELILAINLALNYDLKLVVEEAFENCHEVEVSVLGNESPEASVVGEIIPGAEFYDYSDKYINDSSRVEIPAAIPENASEAVRKYAVQVFKAIDAAGLARVDFFVSKEDYKVYINEINTIPGFTPISMYPKLWEASGVSYAQLIDRLIEFALERSEKRSNIQMTM